MTTKKEFSKVDIEAQKHDILSNRDDLDETSFSYRLFEDGIFDCEKLDSLIAEVMNLQRFGHMDDDVRQTIKWIINCTDHCFISHHDQDDLYVIKNHSQSIESDWAQIWSKQLLSVIN